MCASLMWRQTAVWLTGLQRHHLLHRGRGHRGTWDLQEREQTRPARVLHLPAQPWQCQGINAHLELLLINVEQLHTVCFTNVPLTVAGTREEHFGTDRSRVQVCHRNVEWGQDWNCRSGKPMKSALLTMKTCEIEMSHAPTLSVCVCLRCSGWHRVALTTLFLTPDRGCSLVNGSLTSR